MDGMVVSGLGLAASLLSVVSLMPQVVRTWRTRSAGDISAGWLIIALAAMVLWIIYGSVMDAWAVVWANALTCLQASLILVVKLGCLPRPATAAETAAAPRQP